MGIIEVNEIPAGKKSQREMLRQDFKQAIKKHITKFEIIGDYNYNYLNQSARIVADQYFRSNIYSKAAREVQKELEEELGEKVFCNSAYEYSGKYIGIFRRKRNDRIHIYALVDYQFADNFKEILKKDTRNHYLKIKKQREERKRENDTRNKR